MRVDCRFPGTRVVVELLGYRWHRTNEQMAATPLGSMRSSSTGFAPMQFTYDQVTLDHGGVDRRRPVRRSRPA